MSSKTITSTTTTTCNAILKNGSPCSHHAIKDTLFCGYHSRCNKLCSSGKKCPRSAVTLDRLCTLHSKIALSPKKSTKIGNREMTSLGTPNPSQCISLTKKGTRCTRNRVGDTPHCSLPSHCKPK